MLVARSNSIGGRFQAKLTPNSTLSGKELVERWAEYSHMNPAMAQVTLTMLEGFILAELSKGNRLDTILFFSNVTLAPMFTFQSLVFSTSISAESSIPWFEMVPRFLVITLSAVDVLVAPADSGLYTSNIRPKSANLSATKLPRVTLSSVCVSLNRPN